MDIYRKQCQTAPGLLNAALYLSVFFKLQQGPIITYREFEPQIECRRTTLDDFIGGIWRLAIGLCKKMLIAFNLTPGANEIFASDLANLSFSDAWFGCGVYLIALYYDWSGYTDMAIGLAKIFGFKMPENFNYPYISTSIGEYWRRWHITLCAWFRDYLYLPIVLGPSISFRKFLLRHHVGVQAARTMQNIFIPSCVWVVTGLWHGANGRYTLWGLLNSSAMIAESYLCPPPNRIRNAFIQWFAVMLFLSFTVPLVNTASLSSAVCYCKAMLGGNGVGALSAPARCYLKIYWVLLFAGAIGSIPVLPYLKQKFYPKNCIILRTIWNYVEATMLMAAVILSIIILLRTGTVTFMYQQ